MKQESKKPRPPEKSYAHVPLLDKLGVKPESRVAVLNVSDAAFLAELRERTKDISRLRPRKNSDLIFLGVESKPDLNKLSSLRSRLKSNGAIWAVYPKGVDRVREADVRAAALASGLVDVKIVSFSATHTALKLVIPLAQR